MSAVTVQILKPDDTLLIDIQDEAEKHGLVLVTDGHELKYLPKGWPLPANHTYFRLRPKNALRVIPKGAHVSTAAITAAERLDLFAIYLTLHGMHRIDFEDALADPVLLGCLRNTLEAKRRRLAKIKAKAVADAADFALVP